MSQRQCDKCGEMVEANRAFCPGCGNVLVEEKKRTTTSEFDSLDHTHQIGQTMYNRMLSDMGLNISKQPNAPQQQQVDTPAPTAQSITETTQPTTSSSTGRPPYLRWIIIVGAVIVVLAFLVVAVAAVVVWLLGRS